MCGTAPALAQAPPNPAPIVNGGEHAWVLRDARFPIDPKLATCPGNLPKHEYSAEGILELMRRNGVDKCVIIHVCYYGRDNSYATYCVRTYPDKFRAIGQLVGYRLYAPDDRENPSRLERAI
jgi:predicted TIM-barrel fold metal-dependent hydrolase